MSAPKLRLEPLDPRGSPSGEDLSARFDCWLGSDWVGVVQLDGGTWYLLAGPYPHGERDELERRPGRFVNLGAKLDPKELRDYAGRHLWWRRGRLSGAGRCRSGLPPLEELA